MNCEQVKEMLPILQAFANKDPIQYSRPCNNWKWKDFQYRDGFDEPDFFGKDGIKWRIKPEVKTGWTNIYPKEDNRFHEDNPTKVIGNSGGVYISKEFADYANMLNGDNRIACIQISYTEGEGL